MKIVKIIFSFIVTIWFLFAFLLSFINMYNSNLYHEYNIPSFTQMYKSLTAKSQTWSKNVCENDINNRFIVNGPYIPLLPGKYTVEYHLKGEGKVFVDIVSKKGSIVYNSTDLVLDNNYKNYNLNFEFGLDKAVFVKEMEFRVMGIDAKEVCIDKITLTANERKPFNFLKAFLNFFVDIKERSKLWRL